MQSSKEEQGEIRKPSSVISEKKQRKTTEWERLEISSRKLRDTKRIFHVRMSTIKDRNGIDLTKAEDEEVARIHRSTIQIKILMTQITMKVLSLT